MRFLFIKHSLGWPHASGHDITCYHMMKALAGLGHEVSLATVVAPDPQAIAGLPLNALHSLDGVPGEAANGGRLRPTWLQERYRSYWGIEPARVVAVRRIAESLRADAVVASGLTALPYLAALEGFIRVWNASDELAWHHLSQVRIAQLTSWHNLLDAAVSGLYERAYTPIVDRVWAVSDSERRSMRWIAGFRAVDVVPNGVDGEYYRPGNGPEIPRSAVFWGRLDFGPNIQAIEWFCRRVWPAVLREAPDARFTIVGFRPGEAVRALTKLQGVSVLADVPDLRALACGHALAVFPFVSGGGIKNKLLEAASLGKAIVCTPRACQGLRSAGSLPIVQVRGPRRWARELLALWTDGDRRRQLGTEARRWVVQHHTWLAAAREAVAGVEESLGRRRAR